MENAIKDLTSLFEESQAAIEFEFILTLMNFKSMASTEDTLHEWFAAIEMYKGLYAELDGKEKTRIACLLYSTFFGNSDFYNILGSLCDISLDYKGVCIFLLENKKTGQVIGYWRENKSCC